MFPVDFVILDMAEDRKVPLILGRPFLNTTDAIIHISKKQLNLGIVDKRVTLSVEKAMKYTAASDDTCYFIDDIYPYIENEIDYFLEIGKRKEQCPLMKTSVKIQKKQSRRLRNYSMAMITNFGIQT